jgi:two-component system cell cycle response regulator DivK
MTMPRILVAEDNAVNRELVREILQGEGFEVVEACDGEEALRLIGEEHPDLVILDIQMPRMDGYSLLRAIRNAPKLSGTPTLALTAYAMQGDKARALDAGFDAYVSKPFESAKLLAEVNRLLAR